MLFLSNLMDSHMFWMEKGVDTTGLMKSLEEGKNKLVTSNSTTVSEFDVEGFENYILINIQTYSSFPRGSYSCHSFRITKNVRYCLQ